jgi:hypothetical protein
MDLNAYHKAWMNGATETEAIRAGEDAYFENMAYAAQERAAYEAMEREAYAACELPNHLNANARSHRQEEAGQ